VKRVAVASLAALLMAACAVGIWWWRRPLEQRAFQKYVMTPLTSTGNVAYADISPDGRYLAYSDDEIGQQSLWVQELATSTNLRVLGPVSQILGRGLRFTPDGSHIYYTHQVNKDASQSLYRLSVSGGSPEKILTDVDSGQASDLVSFSPDGKQIVFARHTGTENHLVIANADGSNERRILTLQVLEFIGEPTWAPDGQTIAFGIDETNIGFPNCIAVISSKGGKERRILRNIFLLGMAWLPDQSGLVINGSFSFVERPALWIVSYPAGGLRRITNDVAEYRGVSLSDRAGRLVTVQKQMDSSLWVAPALNPSKATQLRDGASNKDGFGGVGWLPDGRLVYARGMDEIDLWLTDRDGSNRQQLTHTNASAYDPSATMAAGSSAVFFALNPADRANPNIWRIDADGSNLNQITSSSIPKRYPEISPDGTWITYWSMQGPWKMSLSGGDPTNLNPHGSNATISPDGRWIAFATWNDKAKQSGIKIVASDGKAPSRFLPFISELQVPESMDVDQPIRWTAAGDGITYVLTKDGVSNIWSQPINGTPAKQVTNFTSMRIWSHAWSPDGKYLVMARGNFSRDAVMLTDQR
jgi:Tol biopolymer transport system component